MNDNTERRYFQRREKRSITQWQQRFEAATLAVSDLEDLRQEYEDAREAGAFQGGDYTDEERAAVDRLVDCFSPNNREMDFGIDAFFGFGWEDEHLPELPEEYDPNDDLGDYSPGDEVSVEPEPNRAALHFPDFSRSRRRSPVDRDDDGGPDHAA